MRPEFLNGPFAPWAEESEAYDLEVVGKIPEIAGTPKRAHNNTLRGLESLPITIYSKG